MQAQKEAVNAGTPSGLFPSSRPGFPLLWFDSCLLGGVWAIFITVEGWRTGRRLFHTTYATENRRVRKIVLVLLLLFDARVPGMTARGEEKVKLHKLVNRHLVLVYFSGHSGSIMTRVFYKDLIGPRPTLHLVPHIRQIVGSRCENQQGRPPLASGR